MFYSSFPRVALAHAYARCRDTSAKCARRCTFTCRFLTGTSGAARERECDKLGLAEWPVLALRVIVKALIIFISLKILLKNSQSYPQTLSYSISQSVNQSHCARPAPSLETRSPPLPRRLLQNHLHCSPLHGCPGPSVLEYS